MGLKRAIADRLERTLGVSIAPRHRIAEWCERDQVRQLFDSLDIDCVFDVGANTGQHRAFLRGMVGFRGPIVSYEPAPELAAGLRRAAEGDPLWHVRELALDSSAGTASFHVAKDTQFSSLLEPNGAGRALFADGRMEGGTVAVETGTLADELLAWRGRLGFRRPCLKLDTQGHDLAVAAGAGEALGDFAAIRCEASIVPIYSGAPGIAETLEFFQRRGFAPCAFLPNNDGHFPRLIETDVLFVNRALAGLDQAA